jgi:hypothetical protein
MAGGSISGARREPKCGDCWTRRARAVSTALAGAGLLLGALTTMVGAPAAHAATTSHPITWLAAGDSYAAGQGLTRTTEPCADGTGQKGLSATWAVSASQDLRAEGVTVNQPDLVACTGAISDEFFNSHTDEIDKVFGTQHGPQWTPKMKRFDLVTFSFGGNDIGFESALMHCFDGQGCPPDAAVRQKIAELGTTGVYKGGLHIPSYPSFLQEVAQRAVEPGGNIVVMGYPELVEDPSLWPARFKDLRGCDGLITPGIAALFRGWAGDLNATIAASVAKVDSLASDQRNGVHITFLNPVTGQAGGVLGLSDSHLFEPATGARHELCSPSGQYWLNGFSELHLGSRTFHPNQAGADAMGALAGEVISKLTWPWSTPVWRSLGQMPVGKGPPGLSALRCVTGQWCMAAYQNQAYVYSHADWSKVADPPGTGLTDLSCVTSSFCIGVYNTTTTVSGYGTSSVVDLYTSYATVWNGHIWSRPDELDHYSGGEGYGVVHNVSCTTRNFCMAVGGDFGSAVWNGSSWRTVSGNTAGTDGGTAVSCTSTTFCMATPANPNTITWNGKQWGPGTEAVPSSTDWLSQVSCASHTLCLATGTTLQASPYIFDGTSWVAGPATQGQKGGPLSCANLTYCVYSPSNGEVSEFNGTAWSSPRALVTNPDYDESTFVSCAPTFCMATYANQAFLLSVNGPGTPLTPTAPAGSSGSTRAPPGQAASGPLLGAHWCGEYCLGYGTTEPTEVFNGGDPTGDISDVTWSGWGGMEATGSGTSTYVPAGDDVADGYPAPATIVAFDLGTCGNGPAYTAVEWYFPEYGESFNAGNYIEACTGSYAGTGFGGSGTSGNTGTGTTGNTGASPAPQPPPTGNSGNTGTATTQPSPSGNSGNSGNTGTASTGNSG